MIQLCQILPLEKEVLYIIMSVVLLFTVDEDIEKMEEENARMRDELACKICLERKADIVFLPCGHMVSCGQCAVAIDKCPICRKKISGRVKTIMYGT